MSNITLGEKLTGKLTVIKRSDGCNIASEVYFTYPVRLQVTSRPNNDRSLMIVVLDFGGGLVSGDEIRLKFHVKSGASATITSQSTTKAFKTIIGRPDTFLCTDVMVEEGALLALVPQPIQCYNESKLRQETSITLTYASSRNNLAPSLLFVDWYTGGGRSLDHGNWKFNSFHTCTELKWLNIDSGKISTIFKDQSILAGGDELSRHMRAFNIVCLVLLVGPRVANVADKLIKQFSSRGHYEGSCSNGHNGAVGLDHNRDQLLVSCGSFPLVPGIEGEGVLVRIAARSMEQASVFLSCYIGDLDGQLEEDPFEDILSTHQVINTQKRINCETSSEEISLSCGLLKLPLQAAAESANKGNQNVSKYSSLQALVSPMCLYQLVDSSSPTGGFAHSNTLEAACQLHFINENYPLLQYVWEVLLQTTTTMIPFLVRSCRLFQEPENASGSISWGVLVDAWERLDNDLSAMLTSHVARRASSVQGSGILRAYSGVYSQIRDQILSLKSRINDSSSSAGCRGQAATCFGAVCGLLRVCPNQAANMFIYTVARDIINAGVRLNVIGPIVSVVFLSIIYFFPFPCC